MSATTALSPHPKVATPGAAEPHHWPEALRLGALLGAAELVLARFSGGEQLAGVTITISLTGMVLLSAVPARVLDAVPLPGRLRFALHRLLGACLTALIGLGVLGPAIHEVAGREAALASVVALLATITALHRHSGAGARGPYPRPAAALSLLGLGSVVAWLLAPGDLPPLGLVATLGACAGAMGWLASRAGGGALVGLLGVALARLPSGPPVVDWSSREPGRGPDIVLISVDTLRFDIAQEMSLYQRLAAGGLVFTAAQSTAPWTLPSVASLLTGVPPDVHGAGAHVGGGRSGIHPDTPALATELAARGYDTVGVIAPNPFVGASFGLDRGFDYFYQPGWRPHALPRGLQNLAACPLLARATQRWSKSIHCRSIDGEGLTDHALQVLAQRRDRPLFLWIHYLDSHLPYAHTTDPSVSEASLRVVTGDFHAEVAALEGRTGLRDELLAAYRDEVRFVDRQAGRILDALGEAPARGRIITLTADHGEEVFEHGGFEHGHALYQEQTHIPLVISGLRQAPGVVSEPVSLVDLPPTLLAAAGGHSDAMRGADLSRPVDGERRLRVGNMLRVAPDRMFAVRRGDWKAIWDEAGPEQLFHLASDPGETHNLAEQHPELLRDLLDGQPRHSLRSSAPADLGEEQRAMLQALGYVEAGD